MNILVWILSGLVFLVLYKNSSTLRYFAKFTIFFVSSIIYTTITLPFMFLNPGDPRNALMPAAFLRLTSKHLLGLNYKVEGKENIVQNSGCVVFMNHQSALDLIVLAYLWPIMENCSVVSKKEIFYVWPFGLASWLWGTVFIDRLNPESAQKDVNKASNKISKDKYRILMFPEGTRNSKPQLLPFKKGGFHLAIDSQCPIQPVIISKYTFLDDKTHKFGEGEPVVRILPAILTKGYYTKANMSELIDNVRDLMSREFQRLSPNTTTS